VTVCRRETYEDLLAVLYVACYLTDNSSRAGPRRADQSAAVTDATMFPSTYVKITHDMCNLEIFDFKNSVFLKTGLRVSEGH